MYQYGKPTNTAQEATPLLNLLRLVSHYATVWHRSYRTLLLAFPVPSGSEITKIQFTTPTVLASPSGGFRYFVWVGRTFWRQLHTEVSVMGSWEGGVLNRTSSRSDPKDSRTDWRNIREVDDPWSNEPDNGPWEITRNTSIPSPSHPSIHWLLWRANEPHSVDSDYGWMNPWEGNMRVSEKVIVRS